MGVFVGQAWSHDICAFEDEFQGPFISDELGIHVGILMYNLEVGHNVILDVNEVNLFIDDDVLGFAVVS